MTMTCGNFNVMQIIEQSKIIMGGPMLSGDGSRAIRLASLSVCPSF